jgi:hypothetical protein
MPKHTHTWGCLREIGGKLYCTEERTEGKPSLVKNPKKSYLSHPLLFPDAKKFSDIFENHSFDTENKPLRRMWTHKSSHIPTLKLGAWTSVDDGPAMLVNPHPSVAAAVDKALVVGDDETYWKLTRRSGGSTLVTVQYNHIIGSRWIALIRTSTIPKDLGQSRKLDASARSGRKATASVSRS